MTVESTQAIRLQLAKVLAVLPRIEKKSKVLPAGKTATMRLIGREAVNQESGPPEFPVPDETLGREARDEGGALRSTSSATLVRLAKFSTPSKVRAIAFYWADGTSVVARIAISNLPKAVLSRTALQAREAIGGPDLLHAPVLLERGRAERATFVIEELVFGAHPQGFHKKKDAGRKVIDRLFATLEHAELRLVKEKTHPATRERLRRLIAQVGLPDTGPTEAELLSAAAHMVDADHLLPTGWSHGDVVFSNLIEDPNGGMRLIDWESAGPRPVIADMAKLAAAIPGGVGLDRIRSRGSGSLLESPPSSLNATDQAARYYLQELSWWEPKFKRARQASRMGAFDSWVNRRLELLSQLLRS